MSAPRFLSVILVLAISSACSGNSGGVIPTTPSPTPDPTPNPTVTTTIGGKVLDTANGSQLPNSMVEVINPPSNQGLKVAADGQGSFRLSGITSQTFTVRYSHDGYEALDREYTLQLGSERMDLDGRLALKPRPATPWNQLPYISEEGKKLITDYVLKMWWVGNGAVTRWDSPITVWADSNFPRQDVEWAVDFWTRETKGKVNIRIVNSAAEANLTLDSNWPPSYPIPDSSCAAGGPRNFVGNVVVKASAEFSFMSRPECGGAKLRLIIAHEIGHALIPLGGHTSNGDIMSPAASGGYLSPVLLEVVNWMSSVTPGTRPE